MSISDGKLSISKRNHYTSYICLIIFTVGVISCTESSSDQTNTSTPSSTVDMNESTDIMSMNDMGMGSDNNDSSMPSDPDSMLACSAVEDLLSKPLVLSCRYTNPFAQSDECREYLGEWTQEAAETECAQVFTGVSGTVGTEPCETEALLGRCVAEIATGQVVNIHFYEGDTGQIGRLCGQFLEGTFCAGDTAGDMATQRPPLEEALDSMRSDAEVTVEPECIDETCLADLVENNQGITFTPTNQAIQAGVIFYPGAFVDPRAYAPVMKRLARHGFKVIIVPMPDNLALNGVDRALDMMTDDISDWFMVGHSMGGAMAGRFLYNHPDLTHIKGLILWGAYVAEDNNLADRDLAVLSIAGLLDGVSTPDEVEANKVSLPAQTEYLDLEGANHAQFGTYGEQEGDLAATWSSDEQQQVIAASTAHFIMQSIMPLPTPNPHFEMLPSSSAWCEQAQRIVAGLEDQLSEDAIVVQPYDNRDDFATSKPSINDMATNWLTVSSMTRPFGNAQILGAPKVLEGEVWCKMKSRDVIEAHTGMMSDDPVVDCGMINAATVAWAQEITGLSQSISYSPDDVYDTGIDWLTLGRVSLTGDMLSSASIVVGDDMSIPEAYRNVHYCKLWTPTRALYFVHTGR